MDSNRGTRLIMLFVLALAAGGPGVGFRVMVPSIDATFIRSTSSSADFG
jgi:hypothetical protein